MRKYLQRIIIFINTVVSILLFSAWLGSLSFNPFLSFSILALTLPLLLLINILFVLFWLFYSRSKINALISMLPILLCCFILDRFWQIGKTESSGSLSIMSYNIKSLTPYKDIYQSEDLYLFKKKYSSLIHRQSPDILCLQEYSPFRDNLKKIYPYRSIKTRLKGKVTRSLAILSKFPLIKHYSIKVSGEYTNNLFADIVIGQDTLRVVNIHLESLTLQKNNFEKSTINLLEKYNQLYHRLYHGFKLHRGQIDAIIKEINKSPYPVILCGDFNNSPFSYEYSQVTKYLSDAYREKGSGIVGTYHNIIIPVRIDYIFTSDSIKVNRYQIIREKVSDHFPVKIEFTLNK